jgi:uncharacterized membrane protein YccC
VDGALHQEERNSQRIAQALEQLAERISKAVPEPESKEQLVLQQVGLVLELLPELTALHAQINKAA